MGRCL
jgi:hypothetical protein